MNSESLKEEGLPLQAETGESQSLDAIFDAHIAREFADRDVDPTMETMVPEPYVHCVPLMTGGFGGQGVRRFYSEHFVNQIPKDAEVTLICGRTDCELHPRDAMGLPAAWNSSNWKTRGDSARRSCHG